MSQPPGRPSTPTPPRLVVALGLVAAGALVLVAILVTFAALSLDTTGAGAGAGITARLQVATQYLDPGLLVLVPLAVLLARLVEPSATDPPHPATRTVLVGAAAVGAALTFFAGLRLVANLLGVGSAVPSRAGLFFYDLACVIVATGGASWGYREVQRASVGASPAPGPPPPGPPTGFPTGPPTA